MAARDRLHSAVRHALIKEGWTITHDPLPLEHEGDYLATDLGAEYTLAAERTGDLIAVEVKSFANPSPITDFERAVGQFMIYQLLLRIHEPERKLYLAVSQMTHDEVFQKPLIQLVVEELSISLLVVDQFIEEVVQWIS